MPDIIVPIPAFIDPNDSTSGHLAFDLHVPAARTHLAAAIFLGNDNNDGTRIDHYYSDDLGETWNTSKLTESVEINQGVSLATRNFGKDVVAIFWSGPYLDNACTMPNPGPTVFASGSDANDAGNSNFRYSFAKDEWQYSWQTPDGLGPHKIFIKPPGEFEESTHCVVLR